MTRKNVWMVLIVAMMVVGATQLFASDVESMVADIVRSQNVQRPRDVDPDAVSDARLAELGEALMDEMVPSKRQHEFMDRMMGGEGSQSLEAMHQAMGYEYLAEGGDTSWRSRRGGWGMMGGPVLMGGWGGHMGWGGGLLYWIVAIALLGIVVVLVAKLVTRSRSRK